jgi:hypothetical protein
MTHEGSDVDGDSGASASRAVSDLKAKMDDSIDGWLKLPAQNKNK